MAGTSKLTTVIVNLLALLLTVDFFTQQSSGTASNDTLEKKTNVVMQTHDHREHDKFHNIVATQAGTMLLKEHLTSFEQIGTNKKSQDEAWNKVSPEGEEPCARVIKVTDLHWREHDRVGTKHHSTDSRLLEANQTSAAGTLAPTCVTETTATFTANFDNPVADHNYTRHLPL